MNTILLKMSIGEGLFMISSLAFIISMLVAAIIYLLTTFNSMKEKTEDAKSTSLRQTIMDEVKHFNSFQRLYRTYWDNGNAPTNELIAFYHDEQY